MWQALNRVVGAVFVTGTTVAFVASGRAAYAQLQLGPPPVSSDYDPAHKTRLVIVGSGWGSVGVLKALKPDKYDVIVVSEHNYFLFTPLLPSVTVGTLHAASLVEPIRHVCQRIHATFAQGRVDDVDIQNKTLSLTTSDNKVVPLPYDVLILAVGARSITWNVPGVQENCCFLKSISDARKIRNTILHLFEEAALPHHTDDERRRLLHFVVVGGGPTGVEFAAELADFVKEDLRHAFPDLCRRFARISLIQSADHILNTYDAAISKFAESTFKLSGINVILNAWVTGVEPNKLSYNDKTTKQQYTTDFGMCVWTTGVGPQPLVERLASKIPEQNNVRALVTDNHLRVKGAVDVFAIGDCATIEMPRLLQSAVKIFSDADVNSDGKLSLAEFEELARSVVKKHPILATHLASAKKLFLKHDVNHDGHLSIDELKELLHTVDNNLKNLPATAQVASQQGHYLAEVLNFAHASTTTPKNRLLVMHGDEQSVQVAPAVQSDFYQTVSALRPFVYKHAGSLAYVGGDRAVVDFGSGLWGGGLTAMVLWKSAYFSEQVSTSTRVALALEWIQRPFLGRNIAKY